ncbi:MAG: MarR family transcriptional regulator [Bacillota bacterium]|nr:MarR family transcriptional regulator [Bacillota bacterium]
MKDYLISLFSNAVKIKKIPAPKNIPLYLTTRRVFYSVALYDVSFIVAEVDENEKFTAAAYKKQAAQLADAYSLNVAFSFKNMTKSQRNSFISNTIPFICDENQVFLPFLGIALNEMFRVKKQCNIEKMMPVTQLLFLYLAYSDSDDVIKSIAANDLGLSRPNITRASSQLLAMGLIKEYKLGKEVHMVRVANGWGYYELAKDYLINPIQKKFMVKSKDLSVDYPLAGQTALSKFSMLNTPAYEVRAIFKGDKNICHLIPADARWEDEKITEIELWKYDPAIFSKAGVVDPISMLCSIEADDERIEKALDEVLEMKV